MPSNGFWKSRGSSLNFIPDTCVDYTEITFISNYSAVKYSLQRYGCEWTLDRLGSSGRATSSAVMDVLAKMIRIFRRNGIFVITHHLERTGLIVYSCGICGMLTNIKDIGENKSDVFKTYIGTWGPRYIGVHHHQNINTLALIKATTLTQSDRKRNCHKVLLSCCLIQLNSNSPNVL